MVNSVYMSVSLLNRLLLCWFDIFSKNVGLKPIRTKAHRTIALRTKPHMDKSPQVWVKSPHCSLMERQQCNASCANYLPSFTAVFLHPASKVFWTLLWVLKTGRTLLVMISARICLKSPGNGAWEADLRCPTALAIGKSKLSRFYSK